MVLATIDRPAAVEAPAPIDFTSRRLEALTNSFGSLWGAAHRGDQLSPAQIIQARQLEAEITTILAAQEVEAAL